MGYVILLWHSLSLPYNYFVFDFLFIISGIVLLCYDVCVVPFITLFIIEVTVDYEMSRDLKLMVMVIMTMNSALNPFIYIWKCRSLRRNLKERLHL